MGVDCVIRARREGVVLPDEDIRFLGVEYRKAMRVHPAENPEPWNGYSVERADDPDCCDGMPVASARSTTLEIGVADRWWSPDYRRGDFACIAAACEFFRLRGWEVFIGPDNTFSVQPWAEVREAWWAAWANESNDWPGGR